MPLAPAPPNFPANDAWFGTTPVDEEVSVTLPEKFNDEGEVVRVETTVTNTLKVIRIDGFAATRRTSTDGKHHMYTLLEDHVVEIVACEGKLPTIRAVYNSDGTLSAFRMAPPLGSPLEELHNGSKHMSCQNVQLALHGIDMSGVGTGNYAHQGDHIDIDVRFNFPWALRRVAQFVNCVRQGGFAEGVSNNRNKDLFRLPLFVPIKRIFAERKIETRADLPKPYKLLGMYLVGSKMANVYTKPTRHQHVDVYWLKRAVGRCALAFIDQFGPEGAFLEGRVGLARDAPVLRSCFGEMMRTWDPPSPATPPATALELIARMIRGDHSDPITKKRAREEKDISGYFTRSRK